MANQQHSSLGNQATKMHGSVWQSVANAAALAALVIVSDDVNQGKIVKQTDTGQYWVPTTVGAGAVFLPTTPDAVNAKATTALAAGGGTIATTVRQVLLAGTSVSGTDVWTITPSPYPNKAWAFDFGIQAADFQIKNGGLAGGFAGNSLGVIPAGTQGTCWIISDGANCTFQVVDLGQAPTL